MTPKANYVVLFTQSVRQWQVTEVIRRNLPGDCGVVFYPCVELWIRSLDRRVIEPMFPGYVFIRSDMTRRELHGVIGEHRREILSFIKELKISEDRLAELDGFGVRYLKVFLYDKGSKYVIEPSEPLNEYRAALYTREPGRGLLLWYSDGAYDSGIYEVRLKDGKLKYSDVYELSENLRNS